MFLSHSGYNFRWCRFFSSMVFIAGVLSAIRLCFGCFDWGDVSGLQLRRQYRREEYWRFRGSTCCWLSRKPIKQSNIASFADGKRASFSCLIGSDFSRKTDEGQCVLLLFDWLARSYALSWVRSFKITFWVLGFTWCCTTVGTRYAHQLTKSNPGYSKASQFYNGSIVVYVLVDRL